MSLAQYIRVFFDRRVMSQFILGLYGGLPLLLIGSTLQAWMTDAKVDLKTIGIFAFVGLPYTLKFLWAPVMDRFIPPFLDRRRGWILICQVLLVGSFIIIGRIDPASNELILALCAVFIAFFSASQDIVIDAYRRECLQDQELGLGSSLYVNGYRIALLISGAFALFLADRIPWQNVYLIMAVIMATGPIFTLWAPSVSSEVAPPRSMKEAVIEPFIEYFRRKDAWLILAFILLYKIGDTMAGHMAMPMYLHKGYTKTEIAAVAKTFGMIATISGGLLGGIVMLKIRMYSALWIFGIFQGISTAGFALLAYLPKTHVALASVIGFENITSGMATTAYAAFMASLCDRKFTATQYALLTSLMGVPRVIAAAPTGAMVEFLGWEGFFIFCTVIALPGLLLLRRFSSWMGQPQEESAVATQPS